MSHTYPGTQSGLVYRIHVTQQDYVNVKKKNILVIVNNADPSHPKQGGKNASMTGYNKRVHKSGWKTVTNLNPYTIFPRDL